MRDSASACDSSMQLGGIYFFHLVAFSFFKDLNPIRYGLGIDKHNVFSERSEKKKDG